MVGEEVLKPARRRKCRAEQQRDHASAVTNTLSVQDYDRPVSEIEEEPAEAVDLTPEYAPSLACDGSGWKR